MLCNKSATLLFITNQKYLESSLYYIGCSAYYILLLALAAADYSSLFPVIITRISLPLNILGFSLHILRNPASPAAPPGSAAIPVDLSSNEIAFVISLSFTLSAKPSVALTAFNPSNPKVG